MTEPSRHTVRYPSPELPGVPAFSLRAPEGWVVGELADAVVVIGAPPSDDQAFRPNLTVNVERLATQVSLGQVADQIVGSLRQTHGAVVVEDRDEGAPDDDGRSVLTQVLSFTAGGQPVAQIQAVVALATSAGHDLRSVFTLVGSCGQDQRAEVGPVLHAMVESFSLT